MTFSQWIKSTTTKKVEIDGAGNGAVTFGPSSQTRVDGPIFPLANLEEVSLPIQVK